MASTDFSREENKFLAVYCHNARVSKEVWQKKDWRKENCVGSLSGFTLPLIDNSSTSTRITAVNSEGDTTNIWIVKPADQSRGRGIYLFNRLDEFEYVTKSVVQKYITNPLLVEGYKFDLRLYAVVPSYGPFIIYICSDGLVRFATEPFDLNNLKNLYSHLTNASINVSGPGYLVNKPGIGRGCKWNIRQLRQWFQKNALNDRVMWTQIQALIILTLLSQANSISKVANAYELFGFDILIDQQMRPWLIEVNANPALSTDCMVDEMVKKPLVNSVLEMLRLSEPPVGHRSLICLNKQDSRSCKPAKPGFTSNKHLTTTGDRSWRGSIAPDGYSNSLQRLSLQTTATTVTMNTDPQAPLNIMDMGSSCDESASVLSNGTSALRNSSPLSSVCTHRLDRKCARSNTLRPSEGSGSLSQFRSMLLTRPRTDQKRKMKPCPLYGPGSEMLIPELIILAKRYPDVTDSYSDPNQSVRSESLSISSRGRSLRSFRKEDHIKEDSTDKFPLTTEEQDVLTGRYLIPHSFGQLKLAFPFNLVTRIACAKEKSHYPDSKMVVRALSQLVQHRMRELKRGHEIKDLKIIDTPDIWTEMK
ncbi:unnamed protein product [Calicophoron daubneyi]|uniref:ATP-grasp domain-containing protein n=1 Tax=Calicophoron daubneyi TaxID=300641 RepID=A0AAV2TZL9_CALDB